jgi:hypothetical protein
MRRLAAWLSWFAVLLVVWLVLVGVVQDVEIVAGLCAAAIGAAAVELVRSQDLLRYRVEAPWVWRGVRNMLQILPDYFAVLRVAFRPRRGAFRTLPIPAGGERAVDRGRRAWVALATSLSPNRLVIDIDPETGEALVHDLVPSSAPDEVLP